MTPQPTSLFGSDTARDDLRQDAEQFAARAMVMIRRARRLVVDDRRQAIALLTACRASLADHLQRYQRFKHGRIFGPVVTHGTPSAKVVARTMKVDCIHLGDTFAGHHGRWLHLQAADWPGYREEAVATADLMLTRLDAEIRAIRQLLMIADLYQG